MRAPFPAGTVSGAPKIRAMQIIAELEGTARGPYDGCAGESGNIQRSTFNIEHSIPGGIRGWALNVECSLGLRLGERLRTGSGISGDSEQEQSRGTGGDVCPQFKA